jgi:excisionase family DNA binding protein
LNKKNDKKLHKTYWEWQRYKQKETQRLLKKLTDERKIHRLDADAPEAEEEVAKKGGGEYTKVDRDIDALFDRNGNEYNPYEHLKRIREIKPLEAELESGPGEPIDEASLVGPYDDPATYEKKKAVAVGRAEKVVTKKRGRKKKSEEDMSLFDQKAFKGRIKTDDPKRKREELIESLLDPLVTLEDAATILNVCKTTVRRYTNKGVLDCIRTPGGQRRFKLSQVLDFMAQQEKKKSRGKPRSEEGE